MRRLLVPAIVLALVLPPSRAMGAETPAERGAAVPLSLADCLRAGLENNLDLLIARKDPEIARWNVDVQEGAFDGTLGASTTYNESKNEPFNPSFASTQTSTSASVSWAQKLKFGADYSVSLGSFKTDASGAFFNVQARYDSQFQAVFNLPLLRGLGKGSTTEQLVIARRGLEISREDLSRRAQETLLTVEGAYWDLVAAREALRIAQSSLKLARDLHELNKKKVEVGTLAPIEITQAEAGVASREEGVIVAETTLWNAEDNLRRLMGVPKDDPMWYRPISPADTPKLEPARPDLDASISKALEGRPEVRSARRDLQNKELSERAARNRVRPLLDLSAAVTPAGNNFDPTIPPSGGLSGGIGTSYEEMSRFDFYEWRVGLNFSIPVGNRAAKASHAIATLDREKAEIGLQNLEQTIRVDVRTAVREVESGTKRVQAARANVELQRKKLEAEQKKFENGMSTSFEVLTFQNDLGSAELAEIRALADYNKALAGLERAQGTLLEARGMRLEDEGGK